MARILELWPAALIAARGGMNGTQFIKALRAENAAGRDSEMRALLKRAYETLKNNPDEPFADLDSIPDLSTAAPWPTVDATGVSQAVELTYRENATGKLVTVPYQVHSPNGITRYEAIAKAIEAYSAQAERYGQKLVGAVHTKTFILTPGFTKS